MPEDFEKPPEELKKWGEELKGRNKRLSQELLEETSLANEPQIQSL